MGLSFNKCGTYLLKQRKNIFLKFKEKKDRNHFTKAQIRKWIKIKEKIVKWKNNKLLHFNKYANL